MKEQCVKKKKKLALLFSFIGLSSFQSTFTGTCLWCLFVFFSLKEFPFYFPTKISWCWCSWCAWVLLPELLTSKMETRATAHGGTIMSLSTPHSLKKIIFSPWIAFSSVCKIYWSCLLSSLQTVIQDNKLFTTEEISLNNLINYSQLQKSKGRKWWAFSIYQQVGYFQALV